MREVTDQQDLPQAESTPALLHAPLVSIVVIFLNAGKFLEEAIQSVQEQSYDNWELLLVDDGSSDSSSGLALRYAARHPTRVRYLEHPLHGNRGMSASRNLGIRHSRGRYVAFLDADDVWLPHKLEEQVRVLAAHPSAGMVSGAAEYWHSWAAGAVKQDYVRSLGVATDRLITPPTLLRLSLNSTAPTPCPSDVLLRRELIEEVGGFEERFPGMYEDRAFLTKVYLKAPVYVASRCWTRYRQHEASCTSIAKGTSQREQARFLYLSWLADYLASNGVRDRSVWWALRAKQWKHRHPRVWQALKKLKGVTSPAD